MKRMHIHISVDDLAQSTAFYSQLFGAAPTVQHPDYAKWQLDDPRVNFAISQRGAAPGLDHLGIQADSTAELEALESRLQSAGMQPVSEPCTTCCYARSDKHWVQDPSGIAWEAFHTLGSAPTFHAAQERAACCTPAQPARLIRARKS